MPSRDKHESQEYFENAIQNSLIQRSRFIENLTADGPSDEQRYQLSYRLFYHSSTIIQAAYALGAQRDDLKPYARDLVRAVATKHRLARAIGGDGAFALGSRETPFMDGYLDALRVLAIGILCDLPQPLFAELGVAIGHRGEDALIDWFTAYGVTTAFSAAKPAATLIYPHVFQPLQAALLTADPEVQQQHVQRYMDFYYRNMRPCSWYDRHLRKGTGYNGYWAWEAAAIAKILGLDQTMLRRMDYYPGEL